MGRVFLSHSSSDKDFVKIVADLLGKDKCIYDEYTFEIAMKNMDEIFRGLNKTDIFVYFISNEALNSEWVTLELNNALDRLGTMSHKLRQIFPIIIDENIEYTDQRIASFLKKGENSYNLRHINNPKIVYRKIKSQLTAFLMEEDIEFKKSFEFYCGKDDAKACFKKKYYDMNTGPIKCMVISGIDGIGRKSYIRAVLRDVGIIESYYEPMLLTLNRDDGIEDLAVRLSLDLGLGEYKYEDIIGLKTIEEKEELIVELLNKAQEYQEHIIIEDNFCLINQNGNIKYWFEKILEKIAPKLVVSVTSRIVVDNFQYKKSRYIYQFSVTELTSLESAQFIDMYSKINNIRFDRDDIRAMLPALSGYPPQAEYCIEMALKESVEYVKSNLDEIRKKPEQISSKLLVLVIEEGLENEYKAFLRLLADFSTIPITLVYDIMKQNSKYKNIFYRLRNFSLCYHTGASREYIKLNPVIQNFVIRNEYSLGDEIRGIIEKRAIDFYEKVQDDDYVDLLSNSEIKYFLKKGIMEEKDTLPEKYLYSALFLQSIIELYKKRKYNQIIKIVEKLISSLNLGNYEADIESRIRYYYCLALAREKSAVFDSQVEYFRKTPSTYVSYNFLKGFNFRIHGNFEKAEQSYNNIINKGYSDAKTFRELVYIYTTNEEYDKAENIAYHIYSLDKNSIYAIQAYFDCLLFKKNKSDEDIRFIEEMIDTVKEVYLSIDMNSMYYQILAKYEAFMNGHNIANAVKIVEEGIERNEFITYLLKDLFEIYEYDRNGKKMHDTYLRMLEEYQKNEEDKRLEAALEIKKAISSAYIGKGKLEITLEINRSKLLLPRVKNNLIKKIEMICSTVSKS